MDSGMTRSSFSFFFKCEGNGCAATLDLPPEGIESLSTGLFIVTGGNELRSGPHGSQAAMAAHFAALGFSVFRYDRRGVGDSEGENAGWRAAEADVIAAAAAFRAECPSLTQIIGYGNCDGASSLALYGKGAGLSRVILANPWAFDHDGDSAPSGETGPAKLEHSRASTLRYYRQRLSNPVGLLRDVLGGKVNMGQAIGDMAAAGKPVNASHTSASMALPLTHWGDGATLLLAEGDRTALYFKEQMAALGHPLTHVQTCPTASHSFADDAARAWLYEQIEAALSAR